MTRRWLWILALAFGCGDDDGAADSGTDSARVDGGFALAMPVAPAPPELGDCPGGWVLVPGDVPACEPTPGGLTECAPGEVRFVGTAGCEPVDTCPSGDFAEGLPATGVLYVRPGGSGEGSRDAPLGTLGEALARARAGTTIALARGTYDEALPMPSEVTVKGACATETVLSFSGASAAGAVGVAGAVYGAAIESLTIRDTNNVGILVRGELRSTDVVVEGAQGFGVLVVGGRLEAHGLVVRGTRPDGSGEQGFGLAATESATLVLERAVFEDNTQIGIAIGALSTATLHDVASRAQRTGTVRGLAAGLVVEGGALVTGERIELSRAQGAGLIVSGDGRIELDRLVVREIRGEGSDNGFGLSCLGGSCALRRAWFVDTQGTAIASARGGSLDLEDVLIDGVVAPPARPGWGVGLLVEGVGEARLERLWIANTRAAALVLRGPIGATAGALRLEARDLVVRDVFDEGISGVGLYLDEGVAADLERVELLRTTHAAITTSGDVTLRLVDARVADTRPAADGFWGRGLEAVGASVQLERAIFEAQHEVALLFSGGEAALRDVQVRGTLERGCAGDACRDEPGGIGIGVYDDAQVTLDGFSLEDIPLCGVQLARGGSLDLSRGSIREVAVGACVQVDGYDVPRLSRDVRYDAGTSIQSTSHYIPEVVDPLD